MTFKDRIGESWYEMLKEEFSKDYFKRIPSILDKERRTHNIFPPAEEVFTAFRLTSYVDTKVVILGQDPYHGAGQAHGLAFSVKDPKAPTPPSLRNIFDEIERDSDHMHLNWSNDLTSWAKQGVFLLNTTLTVREGQPRSHATIGWQQFTESVIEALNISPQPLVFMLWGSDAKQIGRSNIDSDHHLVLTAPHPSPLSAYRGFHGCGHFSECNNFLRSQNINPINWFTQYEND